jgi:site-specific DNA recombinase
MKNKNVVAYCRSACEEPGTPSSAYSQARTIRQYAKRHGINVREVYIDPGVSGVTLDRPALQRLIADCRAGKIGTVITKDRARLSRDMGQLFALLHVFGKSGVHVEYSTREGQSDLFLETVMLSAIAEYEEATARSNLKH